VLEKNEIISAVRRSDQAWCEQICRWESLGFGVAYHASDFPALPDGHQLRDVWLADVDPQAAYKQTEAYYRRVGLTCQIWALSPEQDVRHIEELLVHRGWRRQDWLAMGLAHWDLLEEITKEAIRILPARAMPKAYRRLLSEGGQGGEDLVQSSFRRLDDPNHEPFVAMADRQAVGRIAYLEVGDIARLADFAIAPHTLDQDTGRVLIAHFLRMARRLLPRAIVARVQAEDNDTKTLLEDCGFSVAGILTQFHRQ